MLESKTIFGKDKTENLLLRLIYNADSLKEIFETGEEKIEKSFEKFYEELESLYDGASRNDNRLFDSITEFVMVHDNVYFDAGFWAGVQLMKKLECPYEGWRKEDRVEILKRSGNIRNKSSENSVMRQFIQTRMDTGLEETLRKDREYQKANKKTFGIIEEIDKSQFTAEQWQLIDNVLAKSNERASEYGRVAYQQGLSDILNLFIEIVSLM